MRQLWPKVVLIVGGLLISALLATALLRPPEPVYNGRPLSYWFERLQQPNPEAARVAIHEIGPQAVPFLLEKVRRENSFLQQRYRAIWQRLPQRLQGCLPKPTVPRMWHPVYQALHLIKPSPVPALVAALTDRNSSVKLVAIDVVRSLAVQSPETVRALIKLLNDRDREVRVKAIVALDRMGLYRKAAVPALIQALGESYAGPRPEIAGGVRQAAAWTLGRIGPDAVPAVPGLTKLLTDPFPRARQQAAAALARIQRDTNTVRLLVEQFDRSWDFQECEGLLAAFRELGPLAKGAAPAVLEKFNSPGKWRQFPESRLREAAIQTLAEIDPDAVWKAHFGSPFAVSEASPQPLSQRAEIGLPKSIPTGLFEQPPGLKLKQP